jgi:hypothetical protein
VVYGTKINVSYQICMFGSQINTMIWCCTQWYDMPHNLGSSTNNPQERAWLVKRNFIFYIQIQSLGPKSRITENDMKCYTNWHLLRIILGRGRGLGNEISYIIFLQTKNCMVGPQINGCTQYMNEKIKIHPQYWISKHKRKKNCGKLYLNSPLWQL